MVVLVLVYVTGFLTIAQTGSVVWCVCLKELGTGSAAEWAGRTLLISKAWSSLTHLNEPAPRQMWHPMKELICLFKHIPDWNALVEADSDFPAWSQKVSPWSSDGLVSGSLLRLPPSVITSRYFMLDLYCYLHQIVTWNFFWSTFQITLSHWKWHCWEIPIQNLHQLHVIPNKWQDHSFLII